MKQFLKWTCLAWVMMGIGSAGLAEESITNTTTQAGDLLRQAYLSVVDAELARAEQHDVEAATAYRAALGFYGRLQAEYPGWQSEMVSYRIAECQDAVAALDTAGPGGVNAEPRLQALLVEIQNARKILSAQPEPVSVLNQKQMEKDMRALRDQLDQELKTNQSLLRKVSKMEARMSRAGLASGTNTQCRAVVAAVKSESRRLMDQSKTQEAISLIKEAAEMMPLETDFAVILAMAQCRIGRYADAIQTLKPLDVRHPVDADALLVLGTAYMGLGEIGDARVATEKALKINPASPEAHYNMAQILLSVTRPDLEGVMQHYQRALDLGMRADPDFENTLRTALLISKLKKHQTQSRGSTADHVSTKALPIPVP